jgi:Bacterial type II/III secretion system short domain
MRRLILGFVVLTGTFAAPSLAQVTQTTVAPQATETPQPTQAAAARPDEFVRTFFLTHAIAMEIQQVLAQLSATAPSPRPVITMNRTTNSLTIRGTQPALQQAEEIIKQLDVPARTPTTTPAAQGQSLTPPAAAPQAPQSSRLPNLPTLPATTNIQLELTITDTISGTPATKTVSMVIMNGSSGMIRTSTQGSNHQLSVDAIASAYQNGLIGVRITFDFTPPPIADEAGKSIARAPGLSESMKVVVSDGKPLVVSQSADAASDRKVTATIKATVLK